MKNLEINDIIVKFAKEHQNKTDCKQVMHTTVHWLLRLTDTSGIEWKSSIRQARETVMRSAAFITKYVIFNSGQN